FRNELIPVRCVMSSKITGAPSTKPPAVMGRLSASRTGAYVPPVAAPPPAGFCGADSCCAEKTGIIANPVPASKASTEDNGKKFFKKRPFTFPGSAARRGKYVSCPRNVVQRERGAGKRR